MKKHLSIIFLSLAAIGFSGLAVTTLPQFNSNHLISISPSPTPAFIEARLSFDTGVYTKYYTQKIPTGSSAFALLQTASQEDKFPITYKEYDFGTLIESIDGLKSTPQKAWIYFINGNSASVGADSYILQPGDFIEWKYVAPQF